MLNNKKILRLAKSAFCLFLILFFVVGCGSEAKTKSNKKKIIKKVVIVESEKSDVVEEDNNYSRQENDGFPIVSSSSVDTKEKRALYKEAETVESLVADVVKPEFSLKSYDWIGPKDYVIVYAKDDRANYLFALKLQRYFQNTAKVSLNITDDSASAQAKEILVGDTNRLKSNLAANEYAVIMADDKLFFAGGHSAMVEEAVKWFVSFKLTAGKVNLISGRCENFNTIAKNNYRYVWGDEFGGSSLDRDKWSFQNRMSGTNMMPALSDSNVINVNEGLLKMTAIRYYDASRPMAQYATNLTLTSEESMSYQYGYLEMRARVPFNRGAWPSWWMVSDGAIGNEKSKADYFIEVDIFEIFSSLDTVTPNIHKWYRDGSHTQYNGGNLAGKTSNKYVYKSTDRLKFEYHIYGFEWTPEKMVMSVDGEDYNTYELSDNYDGKSDMSGFHDNLFVMFNNYIYAPDGGYTTASTEVNNRDLPFEYFVDYIRLYQKSGEGILNLADNT